MPNVAISPPAKFSSALATGAPLVGGKLYTYLAGTSTPQATYTDFNGTTPNANPVILDSRGEADVWLEQGVAYKFVLADANDVTVWTVDGINFSGAGGQTFLAADGTNTAPSYAFSNSTGMGLYRISNNVLGIATASSEAVRIDASQNVGVGVTPIAKLDVNGSFRARGAVTVTTGGLTVTAGGLTVTAGGLTVSAGGAAITGNSTVAGSLTVSAGAFSSRGFADNAATAQWNITSAGYLTNNGNTQPGFAARRITSSQTTAGNVIFNDTSFSGGFNIGTMYDTSTGVATIPTGGGGKYIVTAMCAVDNTSGGTVNPGLALRVNGSDTLRATFAYSTGTGMTYVWCATLNLSAADTVSIRYDAAVTSAVLVGSHFSMQKVA